MKKFIAVVVGLMMLLMLAGVSFSAEPAAPAKAEPAKVAPEKQKPAKVAKADKVNKHHLKASQLTKGYYVSVQGGMSFLKDDMEISNQSNTRTFDFDNGYAFGVAAGKRIGLLGDKVRVEGELGYQKNNLNKCVGQGCGNPTSGDMKAYTFLVNGYYDFVHGKKLVPYLTAGIGLAKVDGDVDHNNFRHVDDMGLAYQVGVGLAYHINDNWHIDLKYRYLAVTDLNGIEIDKMNPEFATNNVFLGIRYRF